MVVASACRRGNASVEEQCFLKQMLRFKHVIVLFKNTSRAPQRSHSSFCLTNKSCFSVPFRLHAFRWLWSHKKGILLLLRPPPNCRLQQSLVDKISECLVKPADMQSKEFARTHRSLKHIDSWKAFEMRTFLCILV